MAVKRDPRRSLGRGLDALIPTNVESAVEAEILPAKKAPEYKDGVIELDIDKVMSNKAQPRKFFDDNKIVVIICFFVAVSFKCIEVNCKTYSA